MAFLPIRIQPPVTITGLVELINRIQGNIQAAFQALNPPLGVRAVQSTASSSTATVSVADRYLAINSRGGPLRLVLPAPTERQEVTFVNTTDSENAVEISRADGKTMGYGETSVAVPANATVAMLCDGSQWWELRYAAR